MTTRIEVIRQESPLSRQVWVFWFHGDQLTLFLDNWTQEERLTSRHAWRAQKTYLRLARFDETIPESEAPLPDDVASEALERFKEQLSVKFWSQRR